MPVEKAHREAGRGVKARKCARQASQASGIAFAAPFADLAGLSHESACQIDEFDVVSAGCFVTGFCDDRLGGVRAANLLQARDLVLEVALLRGVVARLDWKMRNSQKE